MTLPRGSRPSSSCQAALPTAASLATLQHWGPCCPPPHPPPFGGAGRVQPSRQGLWGSLPCGRAPSCVRGAVGLLQGWMAPVQVPCPKKLEGHVSMAGVAPLHAPGHCSPSLHTLLSPWGHRGKCWGLPSSPASQRGPFPPQPAARAESCCWTLLLDSLRPTSPCRQAGRRAWQGTEARAPTTRVQGVCHHLIQLLAELHCGLRHHCSIVAG